MLAGRGRGGSNALVRAVLDWAGPRRVTLRVADGNTAAAALYRRHGFTGAGPIWFSARTPR
ncbi:GNAT family N-acetyltransferase [Amycolatopsis sp. NBC_01307]|uniref:GNAT family N-acetyltransferase n=1 Tax=Amycolatopsis sp. NBC_01307 TaxID=2903561 RepID=UPI002E14FAB5|nr:GNAT family N-acetyltransferase [Amycolatopsis sp. NBC_01307]